MSNYAAANPPAPGPYLILMTLRAGGVGGALLPVTRAPWRRLLMVWNSQAVSQQRLPVRAADSAGDGHGSFDSVLIMFVSVRGRISLLFLGGWGGGYRSSKCDLYNVGLCAGFFIFF